MGTTVWTVVFREVVIASLIVVALLILIPYTAVVPLILLWRFFITRIAKVFQPQLHRLIPHSSIGIACDSVHTKPTWNLVGFMILDGKMDFEKLRDKDWCRIVQKRKSQSQGKQKELVYPELQQTIAQFGGYLFWRWDDNFDLKNHVRYYDYEGELALPVSSKNENAGTYCTEEDLQRVYGGLLAKPWVEGRSMWEFLYIGKFKSLYPSDQETPKEQCVAAYRIHHSMADGYSILKMLQDLSNVEITNRKINFPKLSNSEMFLKCAIFLLKFPYDLARNFVDFFDRSNCWHFFTTKLSREYNSFISKPFSVELIKKIKNQHDVSYNAVLCAAVSGGFCKLMNDAGQEVPPQMSSFFVFPLPNHPNGLGVHASSIAVKLPMANATCSVDRLHQINNGIRKSKYYFGHYLFPVFEVIFGISPVMVTRILKNLLFHTVVLSCLPGPEKSMEFGGAKMTDALNACGALYGKAGLSMILMSVCGKQRFVAHIDKTVFPSAKLFRRLGQYIDEELKEMLVYGNSEDFAKIKYE